MAYGKGTNNDRNVEKRMVSLGYIPSTASLLKLRELSIHTTNNMAQTIWPEKILTDLPHGKELDRDMLAEQTKYKGVFNAVWVEKSRLNAKYAVIEQLKRARECLFGKFKNLAEIAYKPLKDGKPRLLNFPEEWSQKLTQSDINDLSSLADSMNFLGMIELFRKLEKNQHTSLSDQQRDALLAMLDLVQAKYGCPVWNGEDSTVQIHLDQRCVGGGKNSLETILNALSSAVADLTKSSDINKCYFSTPVLISGVVPRSSPIHLKAILRKDVIERLIKGAGQEVRFGSLAIEIGVDNIELRGILIQKPDPYAIEQALYALGDDFGYTNTSAQALVKLDSPLSTEFFTKASEWSKSRAKEYLTTHFHTHQATKSILHNGKGFLSAIQSHCLHIDKLRSEIDLNFKRFDRIKHEVCRILKLPEGSRIDFTLHSNQEVLSGDQRLGKLLNKLLYLLQHISHLKSLRRCKYRTIDGIKRSWFGFLTTQQAKLALAHHAVVVREKLTVMAVEKSSPDYKGRTFNRMLNNGSKGQYLRASRCKLKWYGIPEVTVPSYYTSSTDIRFGVVDQKQRRAQDRFISAVDGREWQADVHAALVLALFGCLKPKPKPLDVEGEFLFSDKCRSSAEDCVSGRVEASAFRQG